MIKHTIYVKITTTYDETARKLLKDFINMKDSPYTNLCTLEYLTCKEPSDETLKELIDGVDA